MNNFIITKERKTLLHICRGIIEGKINTMDDMRKVWPNQPLSVDFFNSMFEEILDSFEHLSYKNGKEDKESLEYLRIYLASEVLKDDKEIEHIAKAYKGILSIKDLRKDHIDEEISRLFKD